MIGNWKSKIKSQKLEVRSRISEVTKSRNFAISLTSRKHTYIIWPRPLPPPPLRHLWNITLKHIYHIWSIYCTYPYKRTVKHFRRLQIAVRMQSNLNSSNTDGLFTMVNSNSFLSPYEILSIAQENKYFGKFSYFIMKLYVVCTH